MLEKLNGEGYDTTVYTFGPGTVFGDHSHSVSKKDAILGGRFLFRMAGEEVWHSLRSKQSQLSRRAAVIVNTSPLTSGACLSTCKINVMTLHSSAVLSRTQQETGQPYLLRRQDLCMMW